MPDGDNGAVRRQPSVACKHAETRAGQKPANPKPDALQQLEHRLRALGDNWDGHHAKAPNTDTIETALTVLNTLPAGMPIPDAYPSTEGGVILEWDTANADILLNLEPVTGSAGTAEIAADLGKAIFEGPLETAKTGLTAALLALTSCKPLAPAARNTNPRAVVNAAKPTLGTISHDTTRPPTRRTNMETNPDTNPTDTSETPDTQPVLLDKELLETIADTMNLIARYLEKLDTGQGHTQNDAVEAQNTDGLNSNTSDTEPDAGDDASDSSEFYSFEDMPDEAQTAETDADPDTANTGTSSETHADENNASGNADGAAQNDDGLDELVDGFDELMDGFGELMDDFVGDMDDFINRADTAGSERSKTPMREWPWSEQARTWPVHGAWTTGMIVAKTTRPAKTAQQPGSDNTAADTADDTAGSSKPRTIVRRCGPYGIRITRQRTTR